MTLARAALAADCAAISLRRAVLNRRIPFTVRFATGAYVVTSEAVKKWIASGRPTKPIASVPTKAKV
jgi:hypothetical protein